jgi:hypothetical protein
LKEIEKDVADLTTGQNVLADEIKALQDAKTQSVANVSPKMFEGDGTLENEIAFFEGQGFLEIAKLFREAGKFFG